MPTQYPKNILVAPLDWGLGHTTRCVPIIRHLRELGHRVYVAGNERQREYIHTTFGQIDTLPLEGYNVTYSRWNRVAQAGLLSQLPGLVTTINAEHNWLKGVARELQLHGIIADNRYGLHHDSIPSVIMTHQLMVQTGMGRLADRAVQKLHYNYLQRFKSTWVVDTPDTPGLGSGLSHAHLLPRGAAYIGLLSQLAETSNISGDDGSLLILLSGPEPARTELSRMLWQQAAQHNGQVVYVDGSADAVAPAHVPPHITYHQWLSGDQLAPLLQRASMVICRSGYSTLMDLVALGKKAILIPTPGQTEQEYLGVELHKQGMFYSRRQKGFDLGSALTDASQFNYLRPVNRSSFSVHKDLVKEWVGGL